MIKLKCPICGTPMLFLLDTPLCPKCNSEELWDLAQVKNLIENPHAWDGFK
jgi:hypothetical protein